MQGVAVRLTTGTDEHGQKNQEAAEASALPTFIEFLDRQSARFRSLFERLDVSFDEWVRTTNPRHKAVVREVLQRLYDQDLLIKKDYKGLYCVGCELFKKKTDLDELGRCPDHQIEPIAMSETNYFFTIGKFQSWLVEQIESRPDWIRPETYRREVLQMLQAPLDDLCVSRPKTRVQLGIELPFDSDYVTYVWFDALLNYISNIGWPDSVYLEWWPSVVHLMAKDIIKTHCIYWPAILRALDVAPPSGYRVHGYWAGEGGVKMSKSLGNVVVPGDLIDVVGTDGLRYYLARAMRGGDAPISRSLVVTTYNAELANNLGNLYSRAVKLARRQFDGRVPAPEKLAPEDERLCRELADDARISFGRIDLDTIPDLAAAILNMATRINNHFDQLAPWKLAKNPSDHPKLAGGMYSTLDSVRILFELAYPIMPRTSERALRNLGADPIPSGPMAHEFLPFKLKLGASLGEDSALFPRADL